MKRKRPRVGHQWRWTKPAVMPVKWIGNSRRPRASPRNGRTVSARQRIPVRAIFALALAGCCFVLGRATAPLSPAAAFPPTSPAPSLSATSEAMAPEPSERPVHAFDCDVSRAAARAWERRDPVADPVRYRVRVLRVVGGDTLRVLWHGRDIAVRLLRIDTPERGRPGFREAADHWRRLIGDGEVDLEFEGRSIELQRDVPVRAGDVARVAPTLPVRRGKLSRTQPMASSRGWRGWRA